MNLRVS